jgi:hypothetical protein
MLMHAPCLLLPLRLALAFVGEFEFTTRDDDRVQRAVLVPGGVADVSGVKCYVASATGGIDALDIATGNVLWHSDEFSQSLFADEHQVIGAVGTESKANRLRVLVLDAANGKRLTRSDPLVFPDWVTTTDQDGRSFVLETGVLKDHLLLKWKAHDQYEGGAPPPKRVIDRFEKDGSGVIRVDLKTGRVENLPLDDATGSWDPKVPDELQKTLSEPYRIGNSWETSPWVTGSRVAWLSAEQSGDQQAIWLNTWDLQSHRENPPVQLLRGSKLSPQLGVDHRYLFVLEGPSDGDQFWWVFYAQTGEQITKLPYEPGTQAITVVKDYALYVVEQSNVVPKERPIVRARTLKAMELKTGEFRWEHPIIGRKLGLQPRPRP